MTDSKLGAVKSWTIPKADTHRYMFHAIFNLNFIGMKYYLFSMRLLHDMCNVYVHTRKWNSRLKWIKQDMVELTIILLILHQKVFFYVKWKVILLVQPYFENSTMPQIIFICVYWREYLIMFKQFICFKFKHHHQ